MPPFCWTTVYRPVLWRFEKYKNRSFKRHKNYSGILIFKKVMTIWVESLFSLWIIRVLYVRTIEFLIVVCGKSVEHFFKGLCVFYRFEKICVRHLRAKMSSKDQKIIKNSVKIHFSADFNEWNAIRKVIKFTFIVHILHWYCVW